MTNNKYLISLKSDLKRIKGLNVLLPYKNLYEFASYHAKDMGQTGHDPSDGTECFDRIFKFAPETKSSNGAENCSYGFNSAKDIVCQLLLDENIPSLGHRLNILDSCPNIVGVGIAPHAKYDFNCVIDFSSFHTPTISSDNI